MNVNGVSALVDSCNRLIHQKAIKTFKRISPENKRWIDLEDVIQDGLIEAWEASKRYQKNHGTKYSTYLFRGLDMALSSRYGIPLRQQKRVAALSELDAPMTGTDTMPEVASGGFTPEDLFQAVSGVTRMFFEIPPVAVSFLLLVITGETGRIRRRTAEDISCIPDACRKLGVTRFDLDLVLSSLQARVLVVEGVLHAAARVGEEDAKVLECQDCRGHFSLNDARTGKYSAESLTCAGCLEKIFASGPEKSCFGRVKAVQNDKTVTEGYSEADSECRLHCRDRAACVRFIKEREKRMSSEAVDNMEVESELDELDFDDVDGGDEPAEAEEKPAKSKSKAAKPAKETKTAKPAKAAAKSVKAAKTTKSAKAVKETKTKTAAKKDAKPAKAAKSAKAVKETKTKKDRASKSTEKVDPKVAMKQGLIKLDDKGRDLPFKPDSALRYCIEQALEPGGVSEKTLEKEMTKLGYDWQKFQRKVILSGKSGDSSLRPYPTTHTWKVETDEKKGTIRVYDLKRIAYYAKMARI